MSAHTPKVLIAEDNIVSRTIISQIVQKLGYEACVVENGEEAIREFSTLQADLVLVDVAMPKLDGYETCRILRTQAAPHIPIVFLSGKTNKEDILKGYEVGGSDFITKPFDHHALSRKVQLAVENKRKIDKLAEKSAAHKAKGIAAINQAEKFKAIEQFIKESYTVDGYDVLTTQLCGLLEAGFGLQFTLQVRLEAYSTVRSEQGVERPLDVQIMENCQGNGKIFCFRVNRALFSYRDFSLLVQNIDDEESNVALILDTYELALARIVDVLNDASLIALKQINLSPWTRLLQREIGTSFDHLSTQMRLMFSDLGSNSEISAEFEKRLLALVEQEKQNTIEKIKNID